MGTRRRWPTRWWHHWLLAWLGVISGRPTKSTRQQLRGFAARRWRCLPAKTKAQFPLGLFAVLKANGLLRPIVHARPGNVFFLEVPIDHCGSDDLCCIIVDEGRTLLVAARRRRTSGRLLSSRVEAVTLRQRYMPEVRNFVSFVEEHGDVVDSAEECEY